MDRWFLVCIVLLVLDYEASEKSRPINENAYKLYLTVYFGVSPTFNIVDLNPYLREEDKLESTVIQMQGEDDEDINTSDRSTPTYK
jgi:hypothetical protein